MNRTKEWVCGAEVIAINDGDLKLKDWEALIRELKAEFGEESRLFADAGANNTTMYVKQSDAKVVPLLMRLRNEHRMLAQHARDRIIEECKATCEEVRVDAMCGMRMTQSQQRALVEYLIDAVTTTMYTELK